MAYRLVRSLVYKRGVGIRETVWVGVWFGKTNSVGEDRFLHAEPRRRSELLHGVLDGGVGGRHRSLMPCERDGQGGGGRRQRAVVGRRLPAVQYRPPGEAIGGELGPLVVVAVKKIESLVDRAAISHMSCAERRAAACVAPPAR